MAKDTGTPFDPRALGEEYKPPTSLEELEAQIEQEQPQTEEPAPDEIVKESLYEVEKEQVLENAPIVPPENPHKFTMPEVVIARRSTIFTSGGKTIELIAGRKVEGSNLDEALYRDLKREGYVF